MARILQLGGRGSGKMADAALRALVAQSEGQKVIGTTELEAEIDRRVAKLQELRAGIPLGAGNRAQRRAAKFKPNKENDQ